MEDNVAENPETPNPSPTYHKSITFDSEEDKIVRHSSQNSIRTSFYSCEINRSQLFTRNVVQFTSKVTFVSTQDEEFLQVPVVRTGAHDGDTEVHFTTKELSAKAGINFQSTQGKLVFADKENVKLIKVPQIHNDDWEQGLCFGITLLADGLIGSDLHADLNEVLVFQIKSVPWPSKEVEDALGSAKRTTKIDSSKSKKHIHNLSGLPEVQKLRFFYYYLRSVMKDAAVWRRTRRRIIVDLLRDVMLFLELLSTVYMIDYVINPNMEAGPGISGRKTLTFQQIYLVAMAAFLVLSVALFHYLDHSLTSKYPLPGMLRLKLQGQVLRQFFHFDNGARERITDGEVIDSMTSNCFEVVSDGIMPAVKAPGIVGKLVAVIAFKIAASVAFWKPFPLEMLLITLVVFPVFPILFMIRGGKRFAKAMRKRDMKFHKVTDCLHNMINRFDIINAFNRRSVFQKEFEGNTVIFNQADVAANTIFVTNDYNIFWVTEVLLAFYIIYGGLQVAHNKIEIGMFMANLEVLKQVGNMWKEIFEAMMTIQRSIPALHNIVNIMNEETDFHKAAVFQRSREFQTAAQLSSGKSFTDMQIIVQGLSPSYQVGSEKIGRPCNLSGMFVVQPGEIATIVGPAGLGKSFLLRLLSGVIVPRGCDLKDVREGMASNVFVPAHNRILYQGAEATFFPKSLYYNLAIAGGKYVDHDRIREILEHLGVSEHIIDKLDDDESYDWDQVLSRTDAGLLNIARALVSNYEVLVFHRPLMALPVTSARKAMDVLNKFVTHRGVGLDPHSWSTRNPRTCILTCLRYDVAASSSSQVFYISDETGIIPSNKESLAHLNFQEGPMDGEANIDGEEVQYEVTV